MSNVDRRSFMKLAGIIGLSAALPFSRVYAADAPLVVGFIYVGARDDFGTTRPTRRQPPSSRHCPTSR